MSTDKIELLAVGLLNEKEDNFLSKEALDALIKSSNNPKCIVGISKKAYDRFDIPTISLAYQMLKDKIKEHKDKNVSWVVSVIIDNKIKLQTIL